MLSPQRTTAPLLSLVVTGLGIIFEDNLMMKNLHPPAQRELEREPKEARGSIYISSQRPVSGDEVFNGKTTPQPNCRKGSLPYHR